MYSKISLIRCTLVALLTSLASGAFAATYYVATTGSNTAGDGAASEHEEDEVDGGRFDRPEREGDPDPDQPSRVLEHRVTSLQSRSPRLAPSPYDVRRGLGVP